MKKIIFVLSALTLSATLASAKVTCYKVLAKKEVFPKDVKTLFLKADREPVQSMFQLEGWNDKDKAIVWSRFSCVTSSPKKSTCTQDDDGGGFDVSWDEKQLSSKYFRTLQIGTDEAVQFDAKEKGKKKIAAAEAKEEEQSFDLSFQAVDCPKEQGFPRSTD